MAKKKKKKRNGLKGLLAFIVILLIIGFIGFFGYKSYEELTDIKDDIDNFEVNVPSLVTDDLTLPTSIGDNIKLEWESSNKQIISDNGEVTQPDFEEGSTKVTLKCKFNITFKELLSSTLSSFILKDVKDLEYSVTVEAIPATPQIKVNKVYERLTMINETYDSINLINKACYDDINITWTSSNQGVLTNGGVVIRPLLDTLVTLTAHITCDEVTKDKVFTIAVLANEEVINVVDDNFDNQAATSTYKDIKSPDGVSYYNARIMEDTSSTSSEEDDVNKTTPSYIRLRNKDDQNGPLDDKNIGRFIIDNISNPKVFKFDYLFSGTQSKEDSKLVIIYTDLLNNTETSEEIIVKHLDQYTRYEKNLDDYTSIKIEVVHIDTWAGDTFINIDNVKVDQKVSIDTIKQSIINNIPSSFTTSVILPFTSIYGGSVTWTSNSDNVTSYGNVIRTDETQTITLKGIITYLGETTTITIEIKITGKSIQPALEIYFIDIGKYGAGDCGESTYIKYGNIDIIVDAGDNFADSKKAINEVINSHLEDGVIEYVIATHPDGDHIGGMASLFDTYNIKNLIKFEGSYHTQKYKNMEKAVEEENCNVYQIKSDIIDQNKQDKFIEITSDIYISFVNTKCYDNEESNGKSIVFTLNAYGTKVLMTGDADNASGHTELENNYKDTVGDIDILKVVHHGTANGSSIPFLKAIDPEVAIICNGNYLGNKHGHPTPTAIYNLYTYDANMKVYCICGGGYIDGVVDTKNITYKCSSEDRMYQRNGTITILIDNNGYTISSEYYNDTPMELNKTTYYKNIKESGLFDLIK